MSDNNMSGLTVKSVKATGFPPGVTTKRSCFPAASQRNATIFPSGDQAGLVGYLISAMRSMVMLPRGVAARFTVTLQTRTVKSRKDRRRVIKNLQVCGTDLLAGQRRAVLQVLVEIL